MIIYLVALPMGNMDTPKDPQTSSVRRIIILSSKRKVKNQPISSLVSDLTLGEESLVTRMEEITQFFLDLLQVTGGDLSL
jgi:hypothetical protein